MPLQSTTTPICMQVLIRGGGTLQAKASKWLQPIDTPNGEVAPDWRQWLARRCRCVHKPLQGRAPTPCPHTRQSRRATPPFGGGARVLAVTVTGSPPSLSLPPFPPAPSRY